MKSITYSSILGLALTVACGSPTATPTGSDLEALTQNPSQASFGKFDKNGDGKIDASEVSAEIWAIIAPADADKDGFVTFDELLAGVLNGTVKRPHKDDDKKPPKGPNNQCRQLDKDKDGAITKAEAGKKWDRISAADTDKDDKVTEAEFDAAVAAGVFKGKQQEHGRDVCDDDDDEKGDAGDKDDDDENDDECEGPSGKTGPTGTTGATGASGDKDDDHGGEHRPSAHAYFEKFDKNNDGALDASEVPEPYWTKIVVNADANADGKVTEAELKAYLEAQNP